jgi:hypothetical protein
MAGSHVAADKLYLGYPNRSPRDALGHAIFLGVKGGRSAHKADNLFVICEPSLH